MKITVIGTGYVGLVSGACLADLGHDVFCVDKDINKISSLKDGVIPIYEPGLEDVVKRCVSAGRLSFTTNLADATNGAECVLLAVGTPTDEETGRADLKYVFAAAEELAGIIKSPCVVVTKSTVPVGTGQKLTKLFAEKNPNVQIEVASNPEFLREGSAVLDFMKPDRIVIGAETISSKNIMQRVYRELAGQGVPILFTNIPTAELIKYASNAFLAMKIAYANEVADICEGVGADVDLVIRGMGMDNRIGGKYMQPGPGFGGSCFPKDTLAMTHIARDAGFPTRIIESVVYSNDNRKKRMAHKVIKALGGSVSGKTIAILGLTFKANTDDMRYSPSLSIVPELLAAGADIKVYDPAGMNEAKKLLDGDIKWCKDTNDCIKNADASVIVTEWPEFASLDLEQVKKLQKSPFIIDLRNLYDLKKMKDAGIKYFSIGR